MSSRIELQNILHTEIPLTRQIGIQVEHCENDRIVLTAPIEPNTNHKCTAFGGSLYSVAVLTGWSFVHHHMQLHQLDGHIVIQHSEVDYKLPVDGKIVAECVMDDQDVLDKFLKTYKRKGRARINLDVNIVFDNTNAMTLKGQYVVHQ